jgi:hypothetical protein
MTLLTWCSLFCQENDSAAVAARARLWMTEAGFTPYDPFSGIPSPAYSGTIKLFVAPARAGWVRLVPEQPTEAIAQLAGALDAVLLSAADPRWHDGDAPSATIQSIALDALPPEVRDRAVGVDPAQIGRMTDRLLGTLRDKAGMSDDAAAAAGSMLAAAGQGQLDLNSRAGRALAAEAARLGLPDGWHTPDFITLRDAFAVQRRLQRFPNARLYPGDAEARDAVPDALAYLPLFGGKRA